VNFLKANGVWPEGLDDPAEPQPGVEQPPAEDRPAADPQETP
jgi:hypothetical protein